MNLSPNLCINKINVVYCLATTFIEIYIYKFESSNIIIENFVLLYTLLGVSRTDCVSEDDVIVSVCDFLFLLCVARHPVIRFTVMWCRV